MTVTFSFDIFSDDADKAKKELEDWYRHTLKESVNDFTGEVARDVSDLLYEQAHVKTGKLKAQTRNVKNVSRNNADWQIIVDPIDTSHGKPVHYAMIEATRSGDHNFTEGFKERAQQSIDSHKGGIVG